MRVLALDDSELALELIVSLIKEAVPEAEVFPFNKPSELLEFAKKETCDIAFLDIQMWGMNGLEVAKALKDIYSKINIIFVTAYKEHANEAFELYPSGYILKPAKKEAVLREIDNLRYPVEYKKAQAPAALISSKQVSSKQASSKKLFASKSADVKVRVQTFGNFDVFIDDKLLVFGRLKAKEAFAYLIDRKGSSVTTAEIASTLWEEREYDRSLQNQTQVIISCMMKTLKENGVSDIIIKGRNQIAVDKSKIKCDYFDFLDWDVTAVNAYAGEYMTNYSWAEMTAGELFMKSSKK
ncbi:MAG: response regulator [Treponema sp.]|nr:response regulator [Treponema sp.]